jgi:hypothetical protein
MNPHVSLLSLPKELCGNIFYRLDLRDRRAFLQTTSELSQMFARDRQHVLEVEEKVLQHLFKLGERPEVCKSDELVTALRFRECSRALPASVGEFRNLVELTVFRCVSWTGIGLCLPASLARLTALQKLEIPKNNINRCPAVVFTLKTLTSLDLSHNCLEEVPQALFELSELKDLRLVDNKIPTLPEESPKCSLDVLHLNGNPLSASFGWLGKHTALTKLYLQGTDLNGVLPEVEKLEKLEILDQVPPSWWVKTIKDLSLLSSSTPFVGDHGDVDSYARWLRRGLELVRAGEMTEEEYLLELVWEGVMSEEEYLATAGVCYVRKYLNSDCLSYVPETNPYCLPYEP